MRAVRLPTTVALLVRLSVSEVVVAPVTAPIAPPLSATVFSERTVLKPKPLITRLVPLRARPIVLAVTTGLMSATGTAVPLLTPFVVTTAVRVPAVGFVDNETVRAVDVALVTVPIAPLLKRTVLFTAVVLNPEPAMVTVVRFANNSVVAFVTVGLSEATWTAFPLLTPARVTIAVRFPAVRTPENVTVKVVAVAAVTVPVTPLLNTTVLLPGVAESKPNPLMTKVAVLSNKLAVLLVMTGTTFATANALPLVTELVVTTAVKLPSEVGFVVNRTVSEVAVAAVTLPTAPRLNATVLFAKVESKPKPLMVTVSELKARLATLVVTMGLMVAT